MAFFLGAVGCVLFCFFGAFLTVELGPVGLIVWLVCAFVVRALFRSLAGYVANPL